MKDLPAFSFLKLRAGYGKTGNDNIPAFQYQDTFSLSARYNGSSAAVLQRKANYYLGWEEAYMASLGVDATINNNWNFTVDLYHTINDKILLEAPQSPSSGFFGQYANVGKVRNMGVELAVDGAIINTRDFAWTVGLNIGFNKNAVLQLPEHIDMPLQKSEVVQLLREGEDVYSWYMPKWAGVQQVYIYDEDEEEDIAHGLPCWEKIDENGNVTYTNNYSDATFQIVGSASPLFSGGINTGLRWKGFSLNMNGSYMVGNKIYNKTRETMDADGAYTNLNQMSINNGLGWKRWTTPEFDKNNYLVSHSNGDVFRIYRREKR